MNNIRLKPAVRYIIYNNSKGLVSFLIVIALIEAIMSLLFVVSSDTVNMSGSFSGFTMASAIAIFIMGICTVREDLRMLLQNGIGRRTLYLAELIMVFGASLLLAFACELLTAAGQLLTAFSPQFNVTSLFFLLYTDGAVEGLSFVLYLQSILFSFLIFACAAMSGIFISLVFYRLNKLFTLIVAIGGPVLIFVALPIIIYKLKEFFAPLINFLSSGPWAVLSALLISAAVISAIDYLIVRRAPVKPAK